MAEPRDVPIKGIANIINSDIKAPFLCKLGITNIIIIAFKGLYYKCFIERE